MLDPYLRTEVNSNKIGCIEKRQKGQISWRTCHDNIQKRKLFEGDRICQRH